MIGTEQLARYGEKKYAPDELQLIPSAKLIYCEGAGELETGDNGEGFQDKVGLYHLPQAYYVIIEDAYLAGTALVGIKDGEIILDTAYNGRIDLYERNEEYSRNALYHSKYGLSYHLSGTVCSLAGVWSRNYYHWTLEQLPKLEAIYKYQEESNDEVTVLIHNRPEAWVLDSLAHFGIKKIEIACHKLYKIDKLLVTTTRRKEGRIATSATEYLQKHSFNGAFTNPKIYITRKYTSARRVINEEALIERLLRHGFSIWALEKLAWKQQVRMFHNAEIVIGPHGAGFSNLAWSISQPRVIELIAPSYANPCVYTLAAAKGLEYTGIVGRKCGVEDIEIDLQEVMEEITIDERREKTSPQGSTEEIHKAALFQEEGNRSQ